MHHVSDYRLPATLHGVVFHISDVHCEERALARVSVLQEGAKFSNLAGTFYKNGMQRTVAALANWLRVQQQHGLIALEDVEEAAGMLLGMVADAPRRAAMFGGLPLPSRSQIEARVRTCVGLFRRGCRSA